jgi:hypothetical protein
MAAAAEKLEPWQFAWMNSARDPWLFAVGVLGMLPYGVENPDKADQLERWQDEFLRPQNFFADANGDPTDNARHSIRSGHGVGKGTTLAILALWFVCTRWDAKAVITANTENQLRDNNWPELRKWYRKLPEPIRAQVIIEEERAYLKDAKDMVFLVRRTASPSNPEALQGIHAKHVLYLVDEASGIHEAIFEAAQGSFSTPGAIAVLTSNPTKTKGFFYATQTTARDRWRTRRVNSEDVPRARGHIADIISLYGKESNKYRVRVLGEFPTKDDDTVIPLEWVEAAKGRKVTPLAYMPVWGADVARFGDDRSTLAKRAANVLLEPLKVWRNLDSTQVAGRIKAEVDATPLDMWPTEILVDVIGYGAGVVDQLINVCKLPSVYSIQVRGINVAEASSYSDEYHRLRDELWFKGRQWFAQKDCTIPVSGCEGLIGELTTVTYDFTVNGKKIVQSKDDMKKDGLSSPDEADGFLLTLAGVPQPRKKVQRRRDDGRTGWTG